MVNRGRIVIFGLAVFLNLVPVAEALDSLSVTGDFRYRQQVILDEGKDTRGPTRFRVRFNVDAAVSPQLDVWFGLSSGPADVEPGLRNQILTGGFGAKHIWLNLAYLAWHPEWAEAWVLELGKIPMPFYEAQKSELVWDNEVNPEGMILKYGSDSRPGAFASLGHFVVEERKEGRDSKLWTVQAGYSKGPAQGTHVHACLGYYDYINAKGYAPFFNPADRNGNSVNGDGCYAYDFNQLEAVAELEVKVGNVPVAATGHWVRNLAISSHNRGWLAGMGVGRCEKVPSLAFLYMFRRTERDAVIGIFPNADFAGGGTDNRGHEIRLSLLAAEGTTLGLSGILSERTLASRRYYNKYQVEVSVRF